MVILFRQRCSKNVGNKMASSRGIWIFLTLLVFRVRFFNGEPLVRENGEEHLEYFMKEEIPVATRIGNVAIDAKLTEKYDAPILQRFRYSFLNQPDPRQDLFEIQEETGIIQTAQEVDRDGICAHEVTCQIWLHVAIQPPEYFQVTKVMVDVIDINDHQPEFKDPEIHLRISESSYAGKTFTLPTAVDKDSEAYGIQYYELPSNSNKFDLAVIRSKIDNSIDLKLILNEELDRERKDFYQVQLVAYDGGRPARSGFMLINITVDDANDNDPKFENDTYRIHVSETVPAGTTIAKVHATDKDDGLNGEILYGFNDRTVQNYGSVFGVDNKTGAIFLKGSLNYEEISTYQLVITAQDRGSDPQTVTTSMIIEVEDSNDNAPEITVNTLTATGVAQVTEGVTAGTFVAHVFVQDLDSGENGQVHCSLSNHDFGLQKIFQTQFKVVTAGVLDREAKPFYELILTCHDKGQKPNLVVQNISVQVADVNDNAPLFNMKLYPATLRENNYVNDFITQLNATDLDEGLNGEVRYSVHGDGGGLFIVHPTTGEITASAVFDYEQIQHLNFRVLAHDLGTPSLTTTATVSLGIIDLNDEPPKFSHSSYTFGTFENEPPNTLVGILKATDADTGPSGRVKYSFLEAGQEVIETFTIEPKSGKIFNKVVLDRETISVYHFTVRVENEGFPPLSASASVTIHVADQNDNFPLFNYPDKYNDTVYISNKLPKGEQVALIEAHDNDSGNNAQLIFSIERGNVNQYFKIDPLLGHLTVGNSLNKVHYEMFTLTISVSDSGQPEKRSYADLNVVVNRSIPYYGSHQTLVQTEGIAIVAAIVSVSLLLILCLLIAIIYMWRRGSKRRKEANSGSYSCRNEAEKMLTATREGTPRQEIPPIQSHRRITPSERYDKNVQKSLAKDYSIVVNVIPGNHRHHPFHTSTPNCASNSQSQVGPLG